MLCGLLAASAQDTRATLTLGDVKATPAVEADAAKYMMKSAFGRVMDSLRPQLITSLNETRKFRIVGNEGVKEGLAEQDFAGSGLANPDAAPELGMMKTAQYRLAVTVDHFLETRETAEFAEEGRKLKRRIQLSAQAMLYDTTTAELVDAANVQIENTDIVALAANEVNNTVPGARTDELMPQMARELAQKLAARVTLMAYPVKIIDVEDDYVTINRGAGFFSVGDRMRVFGPSKSITDPDTGKVIKRKGKPLGVVVIDTVEPDYAQGTIDADSEVKVGSLAEKIEE